MKKADVFCKVVDSLENAEKEKLLTSAMELQKAQQVIRINTTKKKPSNKHKAPK